MTVADSAYHPGMTGEFHGSTERLDPLDLRIIGALQVDGRASWHAIAEALGEAERTVTRRGTRLLDDGVVRVVGRHVHGTSTIVRAQCAPGTLRLAAQAWAARPDSTFACLVTGETGALCEIYVKPAQLTALVAEEIPSTPGVARCSISPVVHYYKTIHEWQPGLITQDEAERLRLRLPHTPPTNDDTALSRSDLVLLNALSVNGRATYDELGRVAGVSESTARRRVDYLRTSGQTYIRAVVDPRTIGLPIIAMLWLRTPPAATERIGSWLASLPQVRYISGLLGEYQLLVQVTARDLDELQRFITGEPWAEQVHSMETCLVVDMLKTSGVRLS